MSSDGNLGWNPTDHERGVYDHYLKGSTRGDLHVHVKRGRIGIMRPGREHGHAFAAWKAGEELARREKTCTGS